MLPLADALAVNAGQGVKMFRFHKTARRIAKRFGPSVARQWLTAVTRAHAGIDDKALRIALTSKNMAQVQKIVAGTELGQLLATLENPLLKMFHTSLLNVVRMERPRALDASEKIR